MAQGLTPAIGPTDVELVSGVNIWMAQVLTLAIGPLMSSLRQVSLGLQDASRQDQQAALYNSTCVHASFGDLELAQMTLRGVVIAPDLAS